MVLRRYRRKRLAALGKFAVPLGGLLRGRLRAGEILVANGATGYFGSAAMLLGLALGAETRGRGRPIARNPRCAREGWRSARRAGRTNGGEQADIAALKAATGGTPRTSPSIKLAAPPIRLQTSRRSAPCAAGGAWC
jgi:hypothetical protein